MHIVCQYTMICYELITSPEKCPMINGDESKRINKRSRTQKEMRPTSSGASLFVGCERTILPFCH
jgi:hypothetical protein